MSTTSGSASDSVRTVTQTYTWTPPMATVTMPPHSPSPTPTPDGVTIPASLYFITLAVALTLICSISVAVVIRGTVLRTRMRRNAAIRALAAVSSGQYPSSHKPPVLWDISTPARTDEKTTMSRAWSDIQPLAVGNVLTPPTPPSASAPAPPQTAMERFLQLPALPPGAHAYMPAPEPTGLRFRTRLRGIFSDIEDLETGIRGASATAIHNSGQVHTPTTEERTNENGDDVRSALEHPVRVGVLLAMPAGEVVLGTLDR